ncbi:MAG: T9SS type A sorting domain-containing protein [Bacteroidia bacterium]|nr:T9SS type A sorting domain-containing protein [Bacteroidia bacterium]
MRFKILNIVGLFLCVIHINCYQSFSQLNGNYTIGGNNPDYLLISDAITDLNQNGVSGTVIFYIRPGEYVENLNFISPNGVSSENQIKFVGENLDSSAVIITSNDTTLYLNGASYLTFKSLTIVGDILINNGSKFNNFVGNQIVNGNLVSSVRALSDPVDEFNEFNSVYFKNYSLSFIGAGNSVQSNNASSNSIINSKFYFDNLSFGRCGLELIFQTDFLFNNNYIYVKPQLVPQSMCNSGQYNFGIQMATNTGNKITNNVLINWSIKASAILPTNSSTQARGLIANNFIIHEAEYLDTCEYGIFIAHKDISIINNTIVSSSNNYGHLFNGLFKQILQEWGQNKAYNNIFCHLGGGIAAYYQDSQNESIDYNSLYSSGSILFRGNIAGGPLFYNLNDLQQIPDYYDDHSVSINPTFVNDTFPDLELGSELCGRGIWVDEVTTDIYGTPRNNPPTIGAFELPSPCVVGLPAELGNGSMLSVSPNPASDKLNLLLLSPQPTGHLEIISTSGQLVESRNIQAGISTIDVSSLTNGIYYFNLVMDGYTKEVKKVVIVK